MNSAEGAKTILKPIFDKYCKAINDQQWDKVIAFYDVDGVVVQTGKKGVYGREAIKQEFLKFEDLMGRTTFKIHGENYQMTPEFIILIADYETITEKIGLVKGKMTQIWKKSNDSYLIYHDEFSIE